MGLRTLKPNEDDMTAKEKLIEELQDADIRFNTELSLFKIAEWVLADRARISDEAFRQGYYCAVASLKRMHDSGLEEELLRAYGKVDLTGIDEYDAVIIRKLSGV